MIQNTFYPPPSQCEVEDAQFQFSEVSYDEELGKLHDEQNQSQVVKLLKHNYMKSGSSIFFCTYTLVAFLVMYICRPKEMDLRRISYSKGHFREISSYLQAFKTCKHSLFQDTGELPHS